MSSVNRHPTFHYSQPGDYSFSHDSVFLARQVFEHCCRSDFYPERGLDLCAGCGVIGLDFLFHARAEKRALPPAFDFLEVQDVYAAHFAENVRSLGEISTELRFLQKNYAELNSRYDLILCNPPYFRQGQGSLSPSEFKNRCRFFIDSNFETLIRVIGSALTDKGKAFMLLRDLHDHDWNPFAEARALLGSEWVVEKRGEIRGTDWVEIRRAVIDGPAGVD